MLYDILIVILTVYAMATPFFIVKSINYGISLGKTSDITSEQPKKSPLIKLPKRKTKESKEREKELEKYRDILSNIAIHDGTGRGQKEIK